MHKDRNVRTAAIVGTLLIAFSAGSVYASALSDAADGLDPGEWTELNTNGFGGLLGACDGSHSILEWANKAAWNPVAREVHYVGQGHVACAKHIRYQESSNTWTTAASPSGIGSFGHGYEHNTANPVNGDFYYRDYASDRIEKYSTASNSWSALPAIGTSTQVAGAIAYFPEANGLLFVDGDYGVYFYNTGTSTWSLVANTAVTVDSAKPKLSMASYHNFASYNSADRVVYFGGGNGSTNVYKVNAQLQVSQVANSPVAIGINNALTVPDPSSGTQLVFANNGNIYAFDSGANSWSNVGTHPVMGYARDWRIGVPITNHGVIMFITWDFGDSKVLLFRYAPGSGAPAPPTPAAPADLSAN